MVTSFFVYNCGVMDYSDRKTQKTIRTKGISDEIFDGFLKETGIGSLDELNRESVVSLIKILNREYLTGNLSLDLLSSAFNIIHGKTIYDDKFHDINDILEIGADLAYYERISIDEEPLKTEFLSRLRDVLKYS